MHHQKFRHPKPDDNEAGKKRQLEEDQVNIYQLFHVLTVLDYFISLLSISLQIAIAKDLNS